MDYDTKMTSSFESWYRGERLRVLTAVTVICGDRHIAEDATHDAFVRAFENWDSVSEMNSPTGWTIKVAHNLIRRSFRRRRALATDPFRLRPDHQTDQAETVPSHIDTWRAIEALTPRQRLAVVLRYVDGRTQAEVAKEMGVSPGTTAASLNQARSNLRTSEHLTSENPT